MFSQFVQPYRRWLETPVCALGSSMAVLVLGCLVSSIGSAQPADVPVYKYNLGSSSPQCGDSITCSAWAEFRKAHPWPFQAYAVSPKDDKGEAVVIISEPPPSLTKQELAQAVRSLFGSDLLALEYRRWPTGVDGWLEDIVARVRIQSNVSTRVMSGDSLDLVDAPGEIVDRLLMLHRLQYKTKVGFWLAGFKPAANLAAIKELKFNANELGTWTADDAPPWTQSTGRKVRDILTERMPGVFTRNGGLVAFVAPNGVKLADLEESFRVFAVSTDLILGATALKGGGLALLARARQVPLSLLPPLRFETLSAFARNRASEVAQSYERQRIFAGRIFEGQYQSWDWAPILLSSQLDDSEYGTLLNFADQILKSWSEHGQVEYYAFPYRKPENYPFGKESASDFFSHQFKTTSLLFNWNTDGFATIENIGGRDMLTPDRTGALSILYRPSGDLSLEDLNGKPPDFRELYRKKREGSDAAAVKARDYFATLGDPMLVRVAQNTLLYQAVQNFLTVSDPQNAPRTARSEHVLNILKQQVAAWLARVTATPADLDIDPEAREDVASVLKSTGLSQAGLADLIVSPQNVQQELMRNEHAYLSKADQITELETTQENLSTKMSREFASACRAVGGKLKMPRVDDDCLSAKRSTINTSKHPAFAQYHRLKTELDRIEARLNALESEATDLLNEIFAKLITYTEVRKLSEDAEDTDLESVLSAVLTGAANEPVSGSIRTPSVVLSKDTSDVFAVGGHNINLSPARIAKPITPNPISGPIRPPEEALGKAPRKNSLLQQLQHANDQAETHPERMKMAVEAARTCNCDALVILDDEGVVRYVRNAPPPEQRTILGKSGLIDVLAEPTRPEMVRFENFSSESVEGIARAISLEGGRPTDDLLKNLASIFRKRGSNDDGFSMMVERSGNRRDVVRIFGKEEALSSFNHGVAWNTGRVEPASSQSWAETFGGQSLEKAENAIIIRFGGGADPSALGIKVGAKDANVPGFSARLAEVARKWLTTRLSDSSPWLEGITDLRATIRRQLQLHDLEFFYQRNAKVIRAAELVHPHDRSRTTDRKG